MEESCPQCHEPWCAYHHAHYRDCQCLESGDVDEAYDYDDDGAVLSIDEYDEGV